MIAIAHESLYLYAFGSASVSRFIYYQALRARRGFQPVRGLTAHLFGQLNIQSGKSGSNGS